MAGYIKDVKIGSVTYPVGSSLYGTCTTGAGTAAKVVTLAAFDTLATGVTIHVKMTNSNTAASPTLNVNSTGAKAIKLYGTTNPGTAVETSWQAGAIISFTYDGTYWVMNDSTNTDSKYTAATAAPGKIASTSAQGSSTNYARQDHTHGIDLATGDSNGQVKIAGTNVSVKGLAAMAYKESVSKSDVGLGNVDNTSDANKPISTATQTALNAKADASTTYTKSEVDSLISAVFTYKGTKATVADVTALTGMKTGDVWFVSADSSEYAYNGTAWEKLGPTIDLSGYLTSVSVAGQTLTPSANSITVAQLKTALGLKAAAYVDTESTVANDAKLPTGAAVKAFVEGKGYTTNAGTVTKVSTGAGLTGGDITATGTVKANLVSETKLTNSASAATETAGRVYPVALDKNGKLAVNVPWTDSASTGFVTGVKGNAESSYRQGAVNLTPANIGLGNVNNTSDANKPISTATQAALNAKADKTDLDSSRIHVVIGTQTATTAAWTGEIDVDELYDGLTILYYLPRTSANNNVTLNLTLANGTTTGAKEVYVTGTSRMTTHYSAGSTIMLTYWSAGSILVNGSATATDRWTGADYWNSNTIGEYAGACIAGPNGMARYSLIMKVNDNHWESLVLSSTTAATKTKNASGFLLDSPILYQSGGTYTNGQTAGSTACWSQYSYGLDVRYSTNVPNTSWSAAGRPFYLVGSISNGKFYLKDTTWWADALPATDDGYAYWYVGQMHSAYQYTMHPVHPLYKWRNGAWQELGGNNGDAGTVNGHTVESNVPSGAKFTDTTYTGTSPITVNNTTISHANSGVTAASKGDTSNQTPGFGSTFKVLSGTVNATGHLTAFADHTVTIPDTIATTSAPGLMSAAMVEDFNQALTDISDLQTSFQDGCSTIANAITVNGVATADNASPSTMAANITMLAAERYNDGAAAVDIGRQLYRTQTGTSASDGSNYYRTYTTASISIGTCAVGLLVIGVSGGTDAHGDIDTCSIDTGTIQQLAFTSVTTTNTHAYAPLDCVAKVYTYQFTGAENSKVTIRYRGGYTAQVYHSAAIPTLDYHMYIISISGHCAANGTWRGSVDARVSGTIHIKVDDTTATIYSNSTKLTAKSEGNYEGHTVSPLTATLSNVSLTDEDNGTFSLRVQGSGSSGNSEYGTTSNTDTTISCTLASGTLSVSASGTISGHGNYYNISASSTTTASSTKAY